MDESEFAPDHQTAGIVWLLPVALALVLGFLGYQQWLDRQRPEARAFVAPSGREARTATAAVVPVDPAPSFTYYLVGSPEQAAFVAPLLAQLEPVADGAAALPLHHVIRIVTSPEEEATTRQALDAANQQLAQYSEPGFRLVDLRPLLAALP
jgi:hypothetical protein